MPVSRAGEPVFETDGSTADCHRYKHMDIADLERCLADATEKGARIKVGAY